MKLTVSIMVVGTALLSGCVTAKEFVGPDGQTSYSVTCNGAANNWGNCLAKMGDICGAKGYNISERNGEAVNMYFGSGFANTSAASLSSAGGTAIYRSIVASCKS